MDAMMKAKIDNFSLLQSKLIFLSDDDFYHIEVIGRKKDGSTCNSQQHYGSWFLTSQKMLQSIQDDVKQLCISRRARAYINLNPKSKKQLTLQLMQKCLDFIKCDSFNGIFSALDSAAGTLNGPRSRKTFIVDVDIDQVRPWSGEDTFAEVASMISECRHGEDWQDPFLVPTLNGLHVISSPFDVKQFNEKKLALPEWVHAEVKTNSPTLLFVELT